MARPGSEEAANSVSPERTVYMSPGREAGDGKRGPTTHLPDLSAPVT
jgi:hypothetical protein